MIVFYQAFKMIQLLALFSYLAIIWGVAIPLNIGDQELIVGGQPIDISEVPYQAAIYDQGLFICGGTILSPEYIITTAHCIAISDPARIPEFSVRVGSSSRIDGGVVVDAPEATYHPNFNETIGDYDIGILKLATPLNFTKDVQPIKLATSAPPDGELVKVSGWGYLTPTPIPPMPSQTLHSVEIPMVNIEICRQAYVNIQNITSRNICAGEEGKSPCFGDSGGPVTYKGKLVGIDDLGYLCGDKNFPEVFTNMADPDIRAFIKKYVPIDE